MKSITMTREQLEDAVFNRTGADMDLVQMMSDAQLCDMLGLSTPATTATTATTATPAPRPPKPSAQRVAKPAPPVLLDSELIDHNGHLCRRLTYSHGPACIVRTGERVQFEGRTVSAALVLHYLRTGERVSRLPRETKPHRAVIRHNGRVLHLGRFASKAEAVAARDAARLRVSLGLDPLG
jgi:hypothetical protein